MTGNGGINYTGVGTDTIRLASGTDTVVDKGGATIFGGSGKFSFTGGSTAQDSVSVGSGSATLNGGGGKNIFVGSSSKNSSTSMIGGAGSQDTFTGGSGKDTMNVAGVKSGLLQFDKAHQGGTHTVTGFKHGTDHLKLGAGYNTKTVLNGAKVVGGNTILNLGDGTTITLTGFTGLKASDFS